MAILAPKADPARVVVVGTARSGARGLSRLLDGNGYACTAVSSAAEAEALLDDADQSFAGLVVDVDLPGAEELVARASANDFDLATIVVTSEDDKSTAEAALASGAYAYIVTPYRDVEVLINVASAFRRLEVEIDCRHQKSTLEQMVRDRTGDVWSYITQLEQAERNLKVMTDEFVYRLSLAAEFRDDEKRRHLQRMSHYTALIADRMGWPPSRCDMIRVASAMHDVGKIGIPDQILMKPGVLTDAEWEVMKRHCQIGHRILTGSSSELLNLAATIAISHHEKVDGSGYPFGLTIDNIPSVGRMVAIADVFDAITSDKVYKGAAPITDAFEILNEGRGLHFDPEMLDLFLAEKSRILGIKERFADAALEDEMSELSALAGDG